jgi:hypothetical protein
MTTRAEQIEKAARALLASNHEDATRALYAALALPADEPTADAPTERERALVLAAWYRSISEGMCLLGDDGLPDVAHGPCPVDAIIAQVDRTHPRQAPDAARCRCGSGAHPRPCMVHPHAFAEHVAELNEPGLRAEVCEEASALFVDSGTYDGSTVRARIRALSTVDRTHPRPTERAEVSASVCQKCQGTRRAIDCRGNDDPCPWCHPPAPPTAPVVAAIVADLRARADRFAGDGYNAAGVLRFAADRIAAGHPNAEAWALGLAEEVRDASTACAAGPTEAQTPFEARRRVLDRLNAIDLDAIVRRRMGGA